jgi:pimeloyl-ACP methyl ester carboxylesterase
MSEASPQFFERPGAPRLHLSDTGGDGLPVVFQHGLCGDAAQPADVFPRDGRFRCVTLEARGHGLSEAGDPADFSIASFAGDVIAMIEALDLGRAVIGGISMGAAIALHIGVNRPDLVRGLILARPAWVTEPSPENMRPNAEVGELLRRFPAEEARSRFEASPTAQRLAKDAPDNLASLRGFFARRPQETTAALLRAISADGPGVTAEQVRALSVPTLMIGHDLDAIHPLSLAEDLASLNPRSQLVKITPKAKDKARYTADFRHAMTTFLERFH